MTDQTFPDVTVDERSLIERELDTEAGRQSMAAAKMAAQVMNLLELAMSASDLTQTELATRLGITEGRVSQVLHGDGNFHVATVARFLSAMGATPTLTATNAQGHLLRRARRKQPNGTTRMARTPVVAQWYSNDGVRTVRAEIVHDNKMSLIAVTVPSAWKGADAGDYQRNVAEAIAIEMKADV